jgi:hypothetical protein
MTNNLKGASLLVAITLFVSGCETTTLGQGVVQGANGTSTDTVSFHIKESFGDDQASVTASFASGERYTGKFIVSKSNTSSSTDFWDTSDSSDDLFTTSSSTTYHSKATGVLFGPSGKTMECGMTLASPSVGFSGGAVGKCKLSTGQVIPMQLSES